MGYPHKFTILLAAAGLASAVVGSAQPAIASGQHAPAQMASYQLAQGSADLSDEQTARLSQLLGDAQRKIDSGDYAGAIALYQQAIQVDRSNPRIYSGIAYLQVRQNNFDAAAEYYRQALDRAPRNLSFHYGLAHSLFMDSRYEQAADAYRDLLDISPRAADAFIGLVAHSYG